MKRRGITNGLGAALACVALAVAGCGSSGSKANSSKSSAVVGKQKTLAKIQKDETCLKADTDYLTLARAFHGMHINTASPSQFNQVAADASTYRTDLTVLRPYGNPTQQAQVDQYKGALSQLNSGLQAAASGNDAQAISDWTGVAPQIPKMTALVNSICRT